jgi:di/tricarboxylate transporter
MRGPGVTGDQLFIFLLLAALFGMLIWGRVRYDLVAFGALIVAVIGGVVPAGSAFAGFGNEAVVIVALVLVVSRALLSAGAIELIAPLVVSASRPVPVHIAVMSAVGASLSAVINNVAALVVLMGLDLEAASKAKRAASLTLMPLAFATILGGMITLIGTPPNIVISQVRERLVGEPYQMFDFAPVGLTCAIVGVAFVALFGWRLIRADGAKASVADESAYFLVEAKVPEKSKSIGRTPGDLYPLGEEHDVTILGVVRRGRRLRGFATHEELRRGDVLVLEGPTKSIEAFIGAAGLGAAGQESHGGLTGKSLTLVEAIVPENARLVGRSVQDMRLLYRRNVTLLGVSRQGRRFRERVQRLVIRPGDVVLLLGTEGQVSQAAEWLGVLPLQDRSHQVIQRRKALACVGIFLGAIVAAVAGLLPLSIALGAAVGCYAMLNIVGPRDVYEAIEWPIIVLLGSLIPIGIALEESGGTQLIADIVVGWSAALPAWAILAIIMVVTMTLSDFMNNVATALVAAPIAITVADTLQVSPDPFLMGVAVAASCAFLTPIGHQNNTIIMGPGGYRFGDYWRLGLPLELIILAVSIPTILLVWPL